MDQKVFHGVDIGGILGMFLKFSLADDFCVAAMTNKFGIFNAKMVGTFSGAGNLLFDKVKV